MPMDRTVAHLNVDHFHHLLEQEMDETTRKMITSTACQGGRN